MKLLMTAALGSPYPKIADDLEALGYEIISADSAACYFGDYDPAGVWMHSPRWLNKGYFVDIQLLIEEERPDFYIPMLDEEILWAHSRPMYNEGLKILSPTRSFCAACLNKEDLMQYLRDLKISTVLTWVGDWDKYPVEYPCIVKPITGRGSRGFRKLFNKNQYLAYLVLEAKQPREVMRQELLEGEEYTVSVVVNNKNQLMALVPKRVIEKRGITIRAVTEHNGAIYGVCKDIVRKMNPCGTFNVQLIVQDGIPKIFEINPRLSTTSILTTGAGVNEIDLMIQYWDHPSPPYIDFKDGVHLYRRWENIFYG